MPNDKNKQTSVTKDINNVLRKYDNKNKQISVTEDIKPISGKYDDKNKQTSVTEDIKHVLGKDESDYSKVADLLLNEKFKRRKTVLGNTRQVGLLSALDVISQIYDIPFLKRYIDYYAQWLTSVDAKGRNDIVDISKFRFEEQSKFNSQILEMARGNR